MILPSKELLREVLAPEFCIEVDLFRENELKIWLLQNGDATKTYINIYELAHKCKEWAKKQKIILENGKEYPYLICSNIADTTEFGASARIMIIDEKFRADTEPEAIFLASQYILDNLSNK